MPNPLSHEAAFVLVPGPSLPYQPWWKELYLTINSAFKHESGPAFPESWTRLQGDPETASHRFAQELGPDGYLAVVFLADDPIACGGVLPFKGINWIEAVASAEDNHRAIDIANGKSTVVDPPAIETCDPPCTKPMEDWEICCFCVHPHHRGVGLSTRMLDHLIDFVKARGGKRLFANYDIEETGQYWPNIGFDTIPGSGGTLKKGWTHTAGMPGLQADVHFRVGVKVI